MFHYWNLHVYICQFSFHCWLTGFQRLSLKHHTSIEFLHCYYPITEVKFALLFGLCFSYCLLKALIFVVDIQQSPNYPSFGYPTFISFYPTCRVGTIHLIDSPSTQLVAEWITLPHHTPLNTIFVCDIFSFGGALLYFRRNLIIS